jgi:hypothetical protein
MKKKLNLTELKVKSFVISLDDPHLEILKGGTAVVPSCAECESLIIMCETTP